jgi:TRAP-type C4-dicarboxylate transport system permease small subunit
MCFVAGIVLLILHELVIRNLFNRSLKSMTELVGIMFLWMAFLGIIVLYDSEGLIALTFLSDRVPQKIKTVFWYIYKVVAGILGAVMIAAFVGLYPYVRTDFFSSMPKLPKLWEYLPMAIAGGFLVLKSIYDLLEKMTGAKK